LKRLRNATEKLPTGILYPDPDRDGGHVMGGRWNRLGENVAVDRMFFSG